ncbi:MAG: sigma-70 family RNA polymerase sigma factor [Clostridia bacterium]|nr:sigma-70 family RNA polymerase sigma factor [Clostridia bacterium]
MDEKTIVLLYVERDEQAIEETKKAYGEYLESIARRILKDVCDAEECVNDALLSAWNDIPKTRPANLKAYLKKLVNNEALSRLRTNNAAKRRPEGGISPLDELEKVTGVGGVAESVETAELAAAISHFLTCLKKEQRVIFVMRYRLGYEVTYIARLLGISESKVKMSLKRTRDRLATFLREGGYLK